MPGAVQLLEKVAVETPPAVLIGLLPPTEVGVVQAPSEKSAKVTLPVGATEVVSWKVAVSPTVVAVPTVTLVGAAWVVIVGEAGETLSSSLASPQKVMKPLLLESPE